MGVAPNSLYCCLSVGSGFACLFAGVCVELAKVIILPVVHLYGPMLVVPFINSFFAFPARPTSFSTDPNSIGKGGQCEWWCVVFDITTASGLSKHHIQRLQTCIYWKHQNTVVGCDVFTGKAFYLAVGVVRNRVYQDGAKLFATAVGVDQRRHLPQWPALGRPQNSDAIELGRQGGFT